MIDKILVLSLDDAHGRRAPLVEKLTRLNLEFSIWSAVDGRGGLSDTNEQRVDRALATKQMGRILSDTELACALSHHDIYREILAQGWRHTLVLEDDAILTEGFADFIRDFAQEDYDLMLLDHWRARVRWFGRRRIDASHRAIRVAGSPLLTTGYVISQQGARSLAKASTPVISTADWPSDLSTLRAYAITPRLVDHPDLETGPSDIRPQRAPLKNIPARWKRRDPQRFLDPLYWKRTYYKRLWKWIS